MLVWINMSAGSRVRLDYKTLITALPWDKAHRGIMTSGMKMMMKALYELLVVQIHPKWQRNLNPDQQKHICSQRYTSINTKKTLLVNFGNKIHRMNKTVKFLCSQGWRWTNLHRHSGFEGGSRKMPLYVAGQYGFEGKFIGICCAIHAIPIDHTSVFIPLQKRLGWYIIISIHSLDIWRYKFAIQMLWP